MTPRVGDRPCLARRATRVAVLLLACSLATSWVFRAQIGNSFSVLLGDSLDGVIQISLTQHWDNVFRGLEPWNRPAYFYPWPDTLGYNDGYLLNGVLFSIFHALGANVFLAAELGNVAMRAAGFIGFHLFAVEILGLGFGWGVLGAVVFTVADNIAVQSLHAQLLSVGLAPLLGWLIGRMLGAPRQAATIAWGCAAAALYGAWLMTAFYTAWFMTLFTAIVALAAVLQRPPWRSLAAWPALPVGAMLVVCCLPFLLVYLPTAAQTSGHPFTESLAFSPSLPDLLHVGSANLLFGGLDRWLTQVVRPGFPDLSEHTVGFPPVLLALAGLGGALRCAGPGGRALLWRAIAAATLASFVVFVRVGDLTLWQWIFRWVPGASAIRAVSRYALFLDIPLVLLATGFLASRSGRWPPALIAILAGILVLEELTAFDPARLHAGTELRFLASIPPPPNCRAFFVTGTSGQPDAELPIFDPLYPPNARSLYQHNVEAMLVAETLALPTVNGFASFNPPDWDFAAPGRGDYLARVGKYLGVHGLNGGVCGLDLATRVWTTTALPPPLLAPGETIALNGDGADRFLGRGWSGVEPGGRWTDGDAAGLFFALAGAPGPQLLLQLDASPFTAPGHAGSAVTVDVNGRRVAEWQPVAGAQTLSAVIPAGVIGAAGWVGVRLHIAAPLAPSAEGTSADERRLGLFVRAFRVMPAP